MNERACEPVVPADALRAEPSRCGQVRLESGHCTDRWPDVADVFVDTRAMRRLLDALADVCDRSAWMRCAGRCRVARFSYRQGAMALRPDARFAARACRTGRGCRRQRPARCPAFVRPTAPTMRGDRGRPDRRRLIRARPPALGRRGVQAVATAPCDAGAAHFASQTLAMGGCAANLRRVDPRGLRAVSRWRSPGRSGRVSDRGSRAGTPLQRFRPAQRIGPVACRTRQAVRPRNVTIGGSDNAQSHACA